MSNFKFNNYTLYKHKLTTFVYNSKNKNISGKPPKILLTNYLKGRPLFEKIFFLLTY